MDAPFEVVIYYFVTWALNTTGYLIAFFGLNYYWLPFLQNTRIYKGAKTLRTCLLLFGVALFLCGVQTIIGYSTGYQNGLQTIEVLGVISRFLNTSFICTCAGFLLFEGIRLSRLDREAKQQVQQSIQIISNLREARQSAAGVLEKIKDDAAK